MINDIDAAMKAARMRGIIRAKKAAAERLHELRLRLLDEAERELPIVCGSFTAPGQPLCNLLEGHSSDLGCCYEPAIAAEEERTSRSKQ